MRLKNKFKEIELFFLIISIAANKISSEGMQEYVIGLGISGAMLAFAMMKNAHDNYQRKRLEEKEKVLRDVLTFMLRSDYSYLKH